MAETDLESTISIAVQDGFSKAFGKLNSELKQSLEYVAKLDKKFGDLSNINLSKLDKSFASIHKTGDKNIVSADAKELEKSLKLNEKLTASQIDKNTAYINDVNNRLSKESKENLASAKTKSYEALAKMRETKSLYMYNGINRYTPDWKGGVTSVIANAGSRFKGEKGLVGAVSRFSEYAGAESNFFKAGGTLNNAFGGLLKSGTLSKMGINAAAPAIGMFVTALETAGKKLYEFGKEAVEAYGKLEQIKVGLGVAFGSDSAGTEIFNQISNYATHSPFDVSQTAELATLLKQSGVYSNEVLDTLKMIGDTAGGNMEKMKRIANNYAQIVSIGKASMLDMRQFAYAGIPIFEAVSDELGVSQQRLRKLIADGKVSSEVIEKVFKDLTGVNGLFENATEKGAKTIAARKQNLADIKNLALGAIGERIKNFGSSYDPTQVGLYEKTLDLKESFWQHLKETFDKTNIAKDVKDIAKRDNKEAQLTNSINLAESNGNFELAEKLKKELEEFKKGRDLKKEQSILLEDYYKTIEEAQKHLDARYKFEEEQLYDGKRYTLGPSMFSRPGIVSPDSYASYTKSARVAGTAAVSLGIGGLIESGTAREEDKLSSSYLNSIMPERIVNAFFKRYTELGAETFENELDSNTKKENSVFAIAQQIKQEWEELPEQKEAAREKELKTFEEVRNILKDIYEVQKEDGKGGKTDEVDMSKISYQKFFEWVDKGALESKAFNIDTLKPELLRKDFSEFKTSLDDSLVMLNDYVKNTKTDKINEKDFSRFAKENSKIYLPYIQQKNLSTIIQDYNKALSKDFSTPEELVKNFEKAYTVAVKELKTTYGEDSDITKKTINLLDSAKFKFLSKTEAKDMVITDESSKSKDQKLPIALWKRIIASNTGIDANVLKSSKQGIDLYNNEVLPRQMAKSMFAGILQEGGNVKSIANLLSYTDTSKMLKGDNQYTRQIDWKSVSTNIENFAMQLRSSTTYISAYKSALQSQLETYNNLIVEGLTTFETQDITNQKTISAKKAGEIMQVADEQFVNAFSGELKNSEGIAVSYIRDGIAYDKNGVELANQELKFTEKMYELMEKELPLLREKIDNANKLELNNSIYGNAVNDLKDKIINSSLTAMGNNSKNYKQIFELNREEIKKYILDKSFDIAATKANLDPATKKWISDPKNMGKESFVSDSLASGLLSSKEYSQALADAVSKVLSNKEFLETLKMGEYYDKLSSDINNIYQISEKKSAESIYGFVNAIKGKTSIWDIFTDETLSNNGLPIFDFGKIDYEAYDKTSLRKARREEANNQFNNLLNKNDAEVDIKKLIELGVSEEELASVNDPNKTFTERLAILKEIEATNELITEEVLRQQASEAIMSSSAEDFASQIKQISMTMVKDSFVQVFSKLGEAMVTGSLSAEDMRTSMQEITAQGVKQIGTALTTCGLNIAAGAALSQNWGMVAAGLGLAAMGGVVGGIGNVLSKTDTDSDDDKTQKLEDLSDKLADLLDQAREDAGYYERNLRHRTALGINARYSNKVTSVNDAIITPSGNVISTAPDDYLIATKTPETLVSPNNNVNVQPKVSVIINKNTRANVDVNVEQRIEPDGSVQLVAMIEDMVGQYIASNRSNEAFEARQAMLQGRKSIM